MRVIIRRYGHYINCVPAENFKQWLINNVPSKVGGTIICTMSLEKMEEIAVRANYTFEKIND